MDEGPVVDILSAVREIRDLVRLLAEPAIAERDRKLRDELRRIVKKSVAKRKAVLLMDGSRTQRAIHREAGINEGHLSTLVKQIKSANLLSGDGKEPKLSISVPANFFENESTDER
jgi:ABC-type thiamine transport system ATPase subunit